MWFYILTHWRSCPGHNPGTEANQPRICIRDVYMFADNKQEHFLLEIIFMCFFSFLPHRMQDDEGTQRAAGFSKESRSDHAQQVSCWVQWVHYYLHGYAPGFRFRSVLAWLWCENRQEKRRRRWTAAGFLLEDVKLPLTFDPNLKGRLDRH